MSLPWFLFKHSATNNFIDAFSIKNRLSWVCKCFLTKMALIFYNLSSQLIQWLNKPIHSIATSHLVKIITEKFCMVLISLLIMRRTSLWKVQLWFIFNAYLKLKTIKVFLSQYLSTMSAQLQRGFNTFEGGPKLMEHSLCLIIWFHTSQLWKKCTLKRHSDFKIIYK